MFLALELVVFVINHALKSVDGLLSCQADLLGLLSVVVFLVLLVVDESSSVVAQLAGGQFGLHEEVCCGGTHLS